MQLYSYKQVEITGGYLAAKQELNRKITINAVYDRFKETGRIDAFSMSRKDAHIFWDSDVAKWMEGAAYLLAQSPDAELERKVEALIDNIEKYQGADGYFNIYYTVCEPDGRFTQRGNHELYCAGHLFEAAVAYAEATGRERFLACMEKYADYIYRVFVEEKSAAFVTPGHEEIELALVRMYRYTGKKKYLDLAAFFINERGRHDGELTDYNQSHVPVREQREAVGHSVRAVYLYSAMADLALELHDEQLQNACDALYRDITERKMYVTGGIGSCHLGETFSKPYDLPNAEAYTETCAGIGLMFFCQRMLRLENNAAFADTVERVFYNGVLSGISLDGKSFFYENPLEITLLDHFSNSYGARRFPITQRLECFSCSCCPPNLNRLLPLLGEYLYGRQDDTLFVNQFAASTLSDGDVTCVMTTDYPVNGRVTLSAQGVKRLAVRIPAWCASFTLNKPYTVQNGYAVVDAEGETVLELDMTPFAVCADSRVVRDAGKLCVQAGPIVYCAESVDNGENLHTFSISPNFESTVHYSEAFGLNELEISAKRYAQGGALYRRAEHSGNQPQPATLHLIPYSAFANRGESDMLVWFNA